MAKMKGAQLKEAREIAEKHERERCRDLRLEYRLPGGSALTHSDITTWEKGP